MVINLQRKQLIAKKNATRQIIILEDIRQDGDDGPGIRQGKHRLEKESKNYVRGRKEQNSKKP